MGTDLKPYLRYKDTGVPWLGQVPTHWEVKPLKRWLRINARVLPETTPADFRFRYIDIGAVGTGRLTETPQSMQFGIAPSRARRVLRQGDTIVSTVRTYLKAVWFVADDMDSTIASTGFAVLTPVAGIEPKYVSYLVQSNAFTDRVSSESVGIAYPAIAEGRVASFKVGIPTLPEQSAIARYLDHADRRIQRYIRAKQKLIKLLEEQKQAIIHRAVTRGLDPNVRLKPSGVEWLGDVPEHWEVRRLKTVMRPIDTRSVTGKETLLSLRRDHGVVIYADHFSRPPQGATTIGYKIVKAGQFVVNRMQANNGLVFHSPHDGLVSPDYSVFEASVNINLEYLSALLRTTTYRTYFRRESTGLGTGTAGFLRLYDDKLLNTVIALPSFTEQNEILLDIKQVNASLDTAITVTQRQITTMNEYRTCLIADVVTGKLDVREAAAHLPDEPVEAEPADTLADDAAGMISEDGEMAETEEVET